MAVLQVSPTAPSATTIGVAAQAIAAGDVVGLPTDTVYGIGANPFDQTATGRIFEIKGRPRDVGLPVLVADADQAVDLTKSVPDHAVVLMTRFWPGPLTLVLRRRPDIALDLGGDDATIGMRCPDHAVALAVCRAAGPVATTSANRHGEPPAATAAELSRILGPQVATILDAGACTGRPSTVLDCTGPKLIVLRQGQLQLPQLLEVLS